MAYSIVEPADITIISSSRSEDNLKILPRNSLSRLELIEAVSGILEEMIETNAKNYTTLNEVSIKTAFHAQKLPTISIKDYLLRFSTYSKCHDDAFVYALIYLDKIGEKNYAFELDTFSVHRFLLLSLVAGCKFYDDYYFKNEYYCKIGGVSLSEFNKLECEFLVKFLQFALYVDTETYAAYYDDLIRFHLDKVSSKKSSSE